MTPVERVFREEQGRVLSSLIRALGDFDAAEEALADAYTAALEQWPSEGVPDRPAAWILRTAKYKAIDRLRRRTLHDDRTVEIALATSPVGPTPPDEGAPVEDDRLRLIFTCCHPALAIEAQVALTLRTLCGLETDEIARAFLVPPATMAQRLVRAKSKIKGAHIPYEVPEREALPERIEAVMAVVYLVFNEGYAASTGDTLVRRELCGEAIRLGRLLVALLPEPAEPRALLALLLLHDSRRDARLSPSGDLVLLEEQDRSRWDRAEIEEGAALLESALRAGPPGPYAFQAGIALRHARASRADRTDWAAIAVLYERLLAALPSPVVALNRAVAVAMSEGPERGLALVDEIDRSGELDGYHHLHAARADFLRRLGRTGEAADEYRRAIALAGNAAEKRFLEKRLAEVSA